MCIRDRNKSIKVVDDQFGSPTWAPWLAKVIVSLLELDAKGIFNVSSKGEISWYDFAREIVEQSKLDCVVKTQSTEELGRPARRPKYSVLDKAKLVDFLNVECITWKQCVKEHIEYCNE